MKRPVSHHEVAQPQDQSIRHIPLTQDQIAIIDAEDLERISQHRWRATWEPKTQSFYAITNIAKKTVYMHRFIMGISDRWMLVDHRESGQTLDNRKCNLRIANKYTNAQNRRINKRTHSGYKGVWKLKGRQYWRAQIEISKKGIYLGTYKTPEGAAMAYDMAAIGFFGEFARTNFPCHIYIPC